MFKIRTHIAHINNLPKPWSCDQKTINLVHCHLQGDLNATLQLQSQGYTIQQIQKMADEPINHERTRGR